MQKLILQNNFLRQCKIFDYISMLFLMPAWLFDWFFVEIGFQTQKVLVLHSTSSSRLLPLFLQCWCPRLLDIKGHVAIMKEPISSTPTTGSRHWVLWLNQHLYIKVEASTIFDILVKLQLGFVLQGVRSTCNNFDKFK